MTLVMRFLVSLSLMASLASAKCAAAGCQASGGLSMLQARDRINRGVAQTEALKSESWINVCYFTNWARYRTGLINKAKDIFEMGLDANLCSHFMYGFASVKPGAGNGGYELESNDPNADHPSGTQNRMDFAQSSAVTRASRPTGQTQMACNATGLAALPVCIVDMRASPSA